MATEEQQIQAIIRERQAIATNYCQKMGWPTDPAQLSFNQIIEIRDQQDWKDAPKKVANGEIKV